MASKKFEYVYRPLDSPDETTSPPPHKKLERLRRLKSQSLFMIVLLLLISYIVVSVLMPDTSIWFLYNDPTRDLDKDLEYFPSTPYRHFVLKRNRSGTEDMACSIPELDPFDKSIVHLVKDPDPVKCQDKFALLFDVYTNSSIEPRTNEISKAGFVSCCYTIIMRKEHHDSGYRESSECMSMSLTNVTNITQPDYEFIGVYCQKETNPINATTTTAPTTTTTERSTSNTTTNSTQAKNTTSEPKRKIVDIFPLVHLKPKVEERVGNYYKKVDNATSAKTGPAMESDKLNVVIFGIDAVSHMNFLRVMPKSYEYLMKNLSAVEMHGYNKIGDNTYPNMGAVLTSLNITELDKCQHKDAFDKCPFIWKEFAKNGFRTAFSEDATWMGIFNYLKSGFKSPPVDYYLRPFGEAADSLIGTHKKLNARLCHGPRLGFQVLLDYLKRLAFTMGHEKRYFHLTWATSLTHDYLNDGKLGDQHLLDALQWFKDGGYFNHTAFILMSDHGARWGDIRDFLQGELEERLPFLYFVLPDRFRKSYPAAFENLAANADRLTTPYDLHQTLLDLLNMESLEDDEIKTRSSELDKSVKSEKPPKAISQFLRVPLSRTCKMAAIEEHFCTCYKSRTVPTDLPLVRQVANYVVYSINKKISEKEVCAFLTLKSVRRAMALTTDPKAQISDSSKWNQFQISIETQPGGAVFESSVGKDKKGFWTVSGTISRTNLYGNQSHCVSSKELKLYCYCVDLLNNTTIL